VPKQRFRIDVVLLCIQGSQADNVGEQAQKDVNEGDHGPIMPQPCAWQHSTGYVDRIFAEDSLEYSYRLRMSRTQSAVAQTSEPLRHNFPHHAYKVHPHEIPDEKNGPPKQSAGYFASIG